MWPVPDSRKALQRFLGFANFYRRYIRNFGQIAAPLTALTSTKVVFRWNTDAQVAFDVLKSRFVSAPVLLVPDPESQFIVEVDASDVGVGAVLSQRSLCDGKVHPCAFFSRRLSPAERNYDIGNKELLAVRLALGEWRHWLEGSAHLLWSKQCNDMKTYLFRGGGGGDKISSLEDILGLVYNFTNIWPILDFVRFYLVNLKM